jgi:uncharacterized protein (DUF305 family)
VLRRAAIGVVALLSTALLAACSSNNGGHDTGDMNHGAPPTTGSQPAATFNDGDVMFAQMMVPHHRQAVEMAALADTRASDPQLKQLATQIKAAQDPEITTVSGWLTAWGKQVPAASGHDMGGMSHGMPGMMSDGDMAKLKATSGKAFDKQFAQMMIDHHNGAIQMAGDEQANGTNPDAKALAAESAPVSRPRSTPSRRCSPDCHSARRSVGCHSACRSVGAGQEGRRRHPGQPTSRLLR